MTESLGEPIVEHAIEMAGGSKLVRSNHPAVEEVYPLLYWVRHNQRDGGKVFRRTILIVQDWEEIE